MSHWTSISSHSTPSTQKWLNVRNVESRQRLSPQNTKNPPRPKLNEWFEPFEIHIIPRAYLRLEQATMHSNLTKTKKSQLSISVFDEYITRATTQQFTSGDLGNFKTRTIENNPHASPPIDHIAMDSDERRRIDHTLLSTHQPPI
jgi:hypothetical protein